VVKSNLDSGIPQAIQHMGIEAMEGSLDSMDQRNATFQRRRDKIVSTLEGIGLSVVPPRASLYVWARIPEGYTSAEFATRLLEDRDIVVTAGTGYGTNGEGYVRLSLTIADEDLEKGIERLSSWDIPSPRGATG